MSWRAPRGVCPECQREYALRWCVGGPGGWGMRRHDALPESPVSICQGTGCDPRRMTVQLHSERI